ncbi:MAG: ADP-ribosyl-(dinitrogen reductase) hydrolase [Deltaproteobacteria bacterium]|nr:MAG: ADP-ribosyl-(dinitrogen reductase) hydrolase [Deltaproteobacteria bacterium]
MRTSQTHPLKIDELPIPGISGLIGMTLCPGKRGESIYGEPWLRDLEEDLAIIREWQPAVVMTLMEAHEFPPLGIREFPLAMRNESFQWLMLPIRDMEIPEAGFERQWDHVRDHLHALLRTGKRILLHCRGGLGRTGTVAARILVEFGVEPKEAVHRVRAARPGTIETAGQERHVMNYRPHPQRRSRSHYAGCLLGGAVGDALGWPVEFASIEEIRSQYGPDGIKNPVANCMGLFEITDDTQMTLFTAEGMLQAGTRTSERGIGPSFASCAHYAYQRWLATQGELQANEIPADGWLMTVQGLHQRRAPGNTCLSALSCEDRGSMEAPLNDSKGCGAVMRMAPVGLFLQSPYVCGFLTREQRDEYTFRTGCELGALTHGHPSGYLSAGCLAFLVARIIDGDSLDVALDKAEKLLATYPSHEETLEAMRAARQLASDKSLVPSPEVVAQLGEGWVGEEALSIGIYCALIAKDDFAFGVRLAVNHGGDSDSTGAITGNILGALLGVEAIPSDWIEQIELRDVIEILSNDLLTSL